MKNKLIGIGALISVSIFLLLLILLRLEGEFFSASKVQLLIVFFTSSCVMAGWYSVKNQLTIPLIRWGLPLFGFALILFSVLVSFNIVAFTSTYNLLIGFGLIYLLLVQLQLLNWGRKVGLITKIASFTLIGSTVFLSLFFMAKWQYAGLRIFIDIAIYTAVISFLFGLFSIRKAPISTPS